VTLTGLSWRVNRIARGFAVWPRPSARRALRRWGGWNSRPAILRTRPRELARIGQVVHIGLTRMPCFG